MITPRDRIYPNFLLLFCLISLIWSKDVHTTAQTVPIQYILFSNLRERHNSNHKRINYISILLVDCLPLHVSVVWFVPHPA